MVFGARSFQRAAVQFVGDVSWHRQSEPHKSVTKHRFGLRSACFSRSRGCKAVRFGKKTRRGHFAHAGITDVRSTIVGEDEFEESVTRVNGAIVMYEVKERPGQV